MAVRYSLFVLIGDEGTLEKSRVWLVGLHIYR